MNHQSLVFARGKAPVWILVAVLVLAGGGAAWWWKHNRADASTAGEAASGPNAGAGFGGKAGGGRRGGGAGIQPVSVMPVMRRDIPVVVNAIGTFSASNTAVVRAQVTGVLQKVLFKEGQQVHKGQDLATIDPRAFQASLSQAEGMLARDKAQLDNARVDLARYRGMLAKDAIAKQQVDTQEALVRQFEGTVKADQAAVENARLQLSYTHVQAPIPGRVGLKLADIGNQVTPGDANGIVSITQTHPIALVFAVPSGVLPKITAGLKAETPLHVQALDRNSKDKLAEGRVSTVDNAIDPTTDTIKLKALFPNEDDMLFPNQAVSVVLQVDTQRDALAVPPAAVLRGTKGYYVYVVGPDKTVSTRVVKPGAVDGNWMAVEGQLEVGEKVVTDGVDRLKDGAKVEVIDADRSKAFSGSDDAHRGGRKRRHDQAQADKASASAP